MVWCVMRRLGVSAARFPAWAYYLLELPAWQDESTQVTMCEREATGVVSVPPGCNIQACRHAHMVAGTVPDLKLPSVHAALWV
jgi:hypothetical protein